jgi:hypothetical protein
LAGLESIAGLCKFVDVQGLGRKWVQRMNHLAVRGAGFETAKRKRERDRERDQVRGRLAAELGVHTAHMVVSMSSPNAGNHSASLLQQPAGTWSCRQAICAPSAPMDSPQNQSIACLRWPKQSSRVQVPAGFDTDRKRTLVNRSASSNLSPTLPTEDVPIVLLELVPQSQQDLARLCKISDLQL